MSPKDKIVVTGFGMISALGNSASKTWKAIEKEKSGLRPLTIFPPPRENFLVGEVEGDLEKMSGLSHVSRSIHLAMIAGKEAFLHSNLDKISSVNQKEIGIILGATTGGMLHTEDFLQKIIMEEEVGLEFIQHHECASTTNVIAKHLKLGGFRSTISTACSSGNMAIATACDVLESGEAKIMLAGGVDSLTRLTVNGFSSLLIASKNGCRPFDKNRDGMTLGEGAGVLVLETLEHALTRQASIYAILVGRASTCDAFHPAAPESKGTGIFKSMSLALKSAKLSPKDIQYINAHGTGTLENDRAEGKAISRLFGKTIPLISSTKGFLGHTLAGSGAIETILCVLTLQKGKAPANLGIIQVDPDFDFTPLRKTTSADLKFAMNNSIGFGGNNCSLILEKEATK